MGIVSLILGILATVFGIFCLVPGISYYGWIGIVLGVAGIVLAALANKKEKKGINTAGSVCDPVHRLRRLPYRIGFRLILT